jgi:hypothetical protein
MLFAYTPPEGNKAISFPYVSDIWNCRTLLPFWPNYLNHYTISLRERTQFGTGRGVCNRGMVAGRPQESELEEWQRSIM